MKNDRDLFINNHQHNLLLLRKPLTYKKFKPHFEYNFYNRKPLELKNIKELKLELIRIEKYFDNIKILGDKYLINIWFHSVVSKSNRPNFLFTFDNKTDLNTIIVGSQFDDRINFHKQSLVIYLNKDQFNILIDKIDAVIKFFNTFNKKIITSKEAEEIFKSKNFDFEKNFNYSTNKMKNFLRESTYIDCFCIPNFSKDDNLTFDNNNLNIYSTNLTVFYKTDKSLDVLFKSLGLNINKYNIFENMARLTNDELIKIKDNAPFLISMSIENIVLTRLEKDLEESSTANEVEFELIKKHLPKDNLDTLPIIGVIDTIFHEDVYFKDYVEYHNYLYNDNSVLKELIEDDEEDSINSIEKKTHGTFVSSLIIDLPSLNPFLDDGCGRFKVRHFGVCEANGKIDIFTLYTKIKEIVSNNSDINVWNISLGDPKEINKYSISLIGSLLDDLMNQFKNIIFVIAGTNKDKNFNNNEFIGSPADSLNSLVVGSVSYPSNRKTEYSRKGPVLASYLKPDVSYYGGDKEKMLRVAYNGLTYVKGTSYAAPLIARKLSYLIDVMHLSRESAKALIIDSAIMNEKNNFEEDSAYIGRGIVPIDINDIIRSNSDEIRVILEVNVSSYHSYDHSFPVPYNKKKGYYNYLTHLTSTYMVKGYKNQGVDYVNDELTISFGNMKYDENGELIINALTKNSKENKIFENKNEYSLRKDLSKYDNVKIFGLTYSKRARPKISDKDYKRGLHITRIERINSPNKENILLSLIIRLKELDGLDYYNSFIQNARTNQFIVNELKVENTIELNNEINTELKIED